jgi:hypothetical protein
LVEIDLKGVLLARGGRSQWQQMAVGNAGDFMPFVGAGESLDRSQVLLLREQRIDERRLELPVGGPIFGRWHARRRR